MALSKQSVVLTNLGGGSFQLQLGMNGWTFDRSRVVDLWNGGLDLDLLLFQLIVALFQAGVNPNVSTFAQIKAAVEAQTYWWTT